LPLTSTVTETLLTVDHVIGLPFSLNRRDALPSSLLAAVSDCPDVAWSLPERLLAAFLLSPHHPLKGG
jgi:hypothetical protein